jgi:hypothetical protein
MTKDQKKMIYHEKMSKIHSKKSHDSSTKKKWISHKAKAIYHQDCAYQLKRGWKVDNKATFNKSKAHAINMATFN